VFNVPYGITFNFLLRLLSYWILFYHVRPYLILSVVHSAQLLWMGYRPIAKAQQLKESTEKSRHTAKCRTGFEPAIPVFERFPSIWSLHCTISTPFFATPQAILCSTVPCFIIFTDLMV